MVATPAGKTKAKQRYLKKKKERRKHNTAKKTQDVVEPTLRAKKEPKRPKKKQRVEEEQLDGQEEDVEVIQVDDEDAMKDTEADEEPMADLGVEEDATETVEQQADDVMVDINEDIADPPALEVNAPFPTFSFPTPPSLPPPKTRLDLPSATIIPNTSSLPLTSLPQNIATRLQDQGITKLSAVQSKIVPHLLHAPLYTSYSPQSDICVSAPTGSGKTLAYAIPIVHVLSQRTVTRLRALILLPTRDLVLQVRQTFDSLIAGTSLKVGTATGGGSRSFASESHSLVNLTGASRVDILICTPGRVMDHISATKGFTLSDLRYLVIDEADRLLSQSYQNWLSDLLVPAEPESLSPDVPEQKHPNVQKMLFSATLATSPDKLLSLHLRSPLYFIVQEEEEEEYTMPQSLSENMVVCTSDVKPLVLFALLLREAGEGGKLVFTKSTESASRLVKLWEFFQPTGVTMKAYSSDLSNADRKSVLENFKKGEVKILVSSDLISRGIDIPHITTVYNYDVPLDMKKYVHRVGRTARAGKEGVCWTLVEEQEARHFKSTMKMSNHLDKIKKVKLESMQKEMDEHKEKYTDALGKLKEVYARG